MRPGTVFHGDCREVMASWPVECVDAVVCDPPYDLTAMTKRFGSLDAAPAKGPAFQRHNRGFMGKAWDGTGVAFDPATWLAAGRVLNPGGHLLAFGGTRTYHRLVCAIEDAGFEIRDSIAWLYGSGFPKSLNLSKAIDRAAGAEREPDEYTGANHRNAVYGEAMGGGITLARGEPATAAAAAWEGWGTALKPAMELIVVARKPLSERSVAANVLRHGTGAMNVDGCRIGDDGGCAGAGAGAGAGAVVFGDGLNGTRAKPVPGLGRWPANVTVDAEAATALDEQSGPCSSGNEGKDGHNRNQPPRENGGIYGGGRGLWKSRGPAGALYGDTGGASRFFYTAKADSAERSQGLGTRNAHPTVKPLALMSWLVRLVTPPEGVVLDPFLGSGTTAIAAQGCGIKWVGIEREAEYVDIARQRLGLFGATEGVA